jgi:hypothetical protein
MPSAIFFQCAQGSARADVEVFVIRSRRESGPIASYQARALRSLKDR